MLCLFFVFSSLLPGCSKTEEVPMEDVLAEALDFSMAQYKNMALSLIDSTGKLPQSLDKNGNLVLCDPSWWVSGFFPGSLWYLYEYSGNEQFKTWAHLYSMRLEKEQYTTTTHDVGFIIGCSFGNGYRLSGNEYYVQVMQQAANSLAKRYHPQCRSIRSWDPAPWNRQWQFPVIIDNLMNLELLTTVAKQNGDDALAEIALEHAVQTLRNHFRNDYSSYHVVSYDTLSGRVSKRHTSQGYNHESLWARGQSWGLYGFTMMYRETGNRAFLEQAGNIARMLIMHPNMPNDGIPYWDFSDPSIPNTLRDASAASIMCSALIELSAYVSSSDSLLFINTAKKQLRTLSSSDYRNEPGTNGNFLLRHAVGHMPNQNEVDVPLIYADYYYVEAIMRMLKRMEN